MATGDRTEKKPLWLSIEENILEIGSAQNLEASIQQIAGKLDDAGYNVSRHGGNMLQLRGAMNEMRRVGRPLMKDFKAAIGALTLDSAADPYAAANKIVTDIGKTFPKLRDSERRPDVIRIVEKTKLDLLIAKARELSGDEGIRLLIEEQVAPEVITGALEISDEKLKQVKTDIANERAERARVAKLLEAVADKTDEEKVKHLFENNVSEELILEMADVDQGAIDGAKKAMEEELKEKQRLAEEEAARKKAEAEGPALDDIPSDELLDHIEAIREILEFSDVEKEIRVMCEQSSIPRALVDIAVSDPDKLDELEKNAEG
jgi:hypothetical protein